MYGVQMDESKFLRCITEESRRNILKFLGNSEKCVCEIVDFLGKEQSVVSHHLASLRSCGLVTSRQKGKKMMYRVSNPKIVQFLKKGEELAKRLEDKKEECE
jgi:DNA-binding transcriptional ArsR family regulator